MEPSVLLEGNLQNLLSGWIDSSVTVSRIESLLGRGGALGLALERWQRAGIWVITGADPEYPERLKRRLGSASPPVLFGCGKKTLLEHGGLAVVGSRDASEEDLAFAERLGAKAAEQCYSIVSGGARGVDQRAMFGALQNEGTAVGVRPKSCSSVIHRRGTQFPTLDKSGNYSKDTVKDPVGNNDRCSLLLQMVSNC